MRFVRYNGKVAVVVCSGPALTAAHPGSDLDDHLGLWFGETSEEGRPIVYTIPAGYVDDPPGVAPEWRH